MAVRTWSCGEDLLPFAVMTMVECAEISMITIAKAAMNQGMSNLVYVVYYNGLGTLILLPYFLIRSRSRTNCPPLTLSLLCRFFILGLVGICLLQVCSNTGLKFSSPTLAAALGNLIPAITFLLAIISRMEKLDLRRSSSQAKSIGTVVAVAGAFVITLYKGPPILMVRSSSNLPDQVLLSQHSDWILGAFFIVITCFLSSTWNILQTAAVKVYPDEMTIVFFSCFFGTIQCAIFTFIMERDLNAWVLQPGIQITSVVFSAVFGSIMRAGAITWCLNKKGPVYVAMFKPTQMIISSITGYIFLGDTLHLGSVIGAIFIAVGFYTVIWGQAKEKKNMALDSVSGLESSTQSTPLLQN